jgi:hypothetical protein
MSERPEEMEGDAIGALGRARAEAERRVKHYTYKELCEEIERLQMLLDATKGEDDE